MPWQQEAMKDVIPCDKPRGARNGLRSADLRMGEPTYHCVIDGKFVNSAVDTRYHQPEHIGFLRLTRGTETSKYPEERKSTETPLVVASERGPAMRLKLPEPVGKPGQRG